MTQEKNIYSLAFNNSKNYLRVHVTGDLVTPNIRAQAWRNIFARCRCTPYQKVLVIQESPGFDSEIDAYETAVRISRIVAGGVQIALVDTAPEHQEHNKMAELVAQNRNVFIRTFTDEITAKQWLLS